MDLIFLSNGQKAIKILNSNLALIHKGPLLNTGRKGNGKKRGRKEVTESTKVSSSVLHFTPTIFCPTQWPTAKLTFPLFFILSFCLHTKTT